MATQSIFPHKKQASNKNMCSSVTLGKNKLGSESRAVNFFNQFFGY
jgi:hypothetical protein